MTEYDFICRKCRERFELEDLEEVQEEEPDYSYLRCPKCHGEDFIRVPKRINSGHE